MSLLEIERLVGGYRPDLDILNGVSLRVEAAEMVSIIGPNGAGKSTVLRAAFGMLPLKQGRVSFDGRDVTGLSPQEHLGLGLAYLPQGHNIFPEMTVEENLELGGYSRKDRRRLRADLDAIYQVFPELVPHRRRVAGHLSGGQIQMIELGRALLLKPRLVLIDEPSLGLSPRMAKLVFAKIREMHESGTAILIVEQNAEASLRLSDRAYVIALGSTAAEGTAEEIRTDPAVRSAYLGT